MGFNEVLANGTELFLDCDDCEPGCNGESGYCNERFECGKCKIVEFYGDLYYCYESKVCVDCCKKKCCKQQDVRPRVRVSARSQALSDLFPAN